MICTAVSKGPSSCKWLVKLEPAGVCCSQQCSADVSWKPTVELAMMLSRPVTLKQDCAAHRSNMSRLQFHCSAGLGAQLIARCYYTPAGMPGKCAMHTYSRSIKMTCCVNPADQRWATSKSLAAGCCG